MEGRYIPFADGMFDVALVNGIFNLNPDRAGLFQELAGSKGASAVMAGGPFMLSQCGTANPV